MKQEALELKTPNQGDNSDSAVLRPSQAHNGRQPRGQKNPATEAETLPGNDNSTRESSINSGAANWDHREAYPEGGLSEEARAAIRAAKTALRPVSRAYGRHEHALDRSQASLCKALARTFAWGLEHKDSPEVINELLTKHRIKITKPVRDNVYLAAIKLANPDATADALTRWSGALAYCAAAGCPADRVETYLSENGIRESADKWSEIRRSGKGNARKKREPKIDPLEELRKHSLGISLPTDIPLAEDAAGPLLLVADKAEHGLIVHACVTDESLIKSAIRNAIRTRAKS